MNCREEWLVFSCLKCEVKWLVFICFECGEKWLDKIWVFIVGKNVFSIEMSVGENGFCFLFEMWGKCVVIWRKMACIVLFPMWGKMSCIALFEMCGKRACINLF